MNATTQTAPRILVIDAQGGGIGKQLVSSIKRELPSAHITAVGTNSAATSSMLKSGADVSATGENAVIVGCRKADVIVGPIGMMFADAMNGEITPAMALAVAQSPAARVLIPFSHCDNYIVGVAGLSTGKLVAAAVEQLRRLVGPPLL